MAHELLGVYVAHTWLAEAALGSGLAGPNALRYFDGCLAIMAALPAGAAITMETFPQWHHKYYRSRILA